MEQPKQEICTFRIMFPVESDEQAIDYKKKIAAMLSDIEGVQVEFKIITTPTR